MFGDNEPEVSVHVLDVTPTIIEFETPVDGNPEARLLASVSEFLGSRERVVLEALVFQYRLTRQAGHVLVGTVYTRYPIAGIDFDVDDPWR